MTKNSDYTSQDRSMTNTIGSSEKIAHNRVKYGAVIFSLLYTSLLWELSFSFPDNPQVSSLEYPTMLKYTEYVATTSFSSLLVANVIAYMVEKQPGKQVQLIYAIYTNFICAVTGFMVITNRAPLIQNKIGSTFNPCRILTWIFTTPVFILMIADRLSSAANKSSDVVTALTADIGMLILGVGVEIAPPLIAACCHLLSYVGFVFLLDKLWIIFQCAIEEQAGQRKILTFTSWWCQTVWWIFPVIATLRFMNLVEDGLAEALYTCAHLLTKSVFTTLLVRDYYLSESEKEHLRTAKVMQVNQRILLKQLNELIMHKDALLSSTSKDLSAPVHKIIDLSESMLSLRENGESTHVNPNIAKPLSAIHQCGSRLKLIVDNILDVASMRASTSMHIEQVQVDLLPIVSSCVSAVRSCLSEQVELEVDDNGISQLPSVRSDKRHIRQIVYNLLANAVKFTNSGRVSIFADVIVQKSSLMDRKFIKMYIKDTGVGIQESQMANIFEPFVQIDSDDTRSYGGAGLGLSVVKKLVTAHGGQVFVKSQFGHGSTFSFTIPVPASTHTKGAPQSLDDVLDHDETRY